MWKYKNQGGEGSSGEVLLIQCWRWGAVCNAGTSPSGHRASAGTALAALASSVPSAQLAQGTSLGSDHLWHFVLQLTRWQWCLYSV